MAKSASKSPKKPARPADFKKVQKELKAQLAKAKKELAREKERGKKAAERAKKELEKAREVARERLKQARLDTRRAVKDALKSAKKSAAQAKTDKASSPTVTALPVRSDEPDATWTVTALRARGRERGIANYSRLSKEDLLERLKSG